MPGVLGAPAECEGSLDELQTADKAGHKHRGDKRQIRAVVGGAYGLVYP